MAFMIALGRPFAITGYLKQRRDFEKRKEMGTNAS
jgi:hypothetical protein